MTLSMRNFLAVDEDTLTQSLEQRGPMSPLLEAIGTRLSGPGKAAVGRAVGSAADTLLDLDLGEMLLAGWRTYEALRKAARSTVTEPSSTELVELASHRITSTYEPHVDLYVDDKKLYELKLTLSVLFEVHSLIATVRAAHLVDLQCGRCDVTGKMSWSGGTLLEKSGQIEAPLVVPLGSGVPLLHVTELPAASWRGTARVSPLPLSWEEAR